MVSVREGGNAELVCLVVDGKPRPPILWSRAEKDLLMPAGKTTVETPDGRLRLRNVSRDMMGLYRCQSAPYNGLNIKRREAQVQLNVQCKCQADYVHPRPQLHTTALFRSSSRGALVESTCAFCCSLVCCNKSRCVRTAFKYYYCCILSTNNIRQDNMKL